MRNILDYIEEHEPPVYLRTQYRVIEISSKLADRQAEQHQMQQQPFRSRSPDSHPHERRHRHRIQVVNKSVFDWSQYVPDPCSFIAMEVIVSHSAVALPIHDSHG